MTATRKVLGQVAPAAATWTDLYTCGAAGGAVASLFSATNRSAVDTKVSMAVRKNGDALADKHYEVCEFTVPGKDSLRHAEGFTFGTTDVVSVWCEAANISFGLYGMEFS